MNTDDLQKKHKAFMRYDGNDVVSLLIHAGELQTELLAEVKRLREGIKQIARDYGFNAIKSQSRHCARPTYDVPAGDGIHTVTFHQKACLKIMELIE